MSEPTNTNGNASIISEASNVEQSASPTPEPTSDAAGQLTPAQHMEINKGKPRAEIPEGMSKSAWKKLEKRRRWAEDHEKHKEVKRVKRKQSRRERRLKIQQAEENGEDITELLPSKKRQKVEQQVETGVRILLDCSFDDMMLDKEVVSLSSQITRSYSENKRNLHNVDLTVTDFNKRLKTRYETRIPAFKDWDEKYIKFHEGSLESHLPLENKEELDKVVYLSADTDEILQELKEGETYIVGGIVDKGRYKGLCKDKAVKLGLKTKRLPIDEFIRLSGRRVLATSHVIELLIKWFDCKDWKEAFESVIPSRKFLTDGEDLTTEAGETGEDNDDANENTEVVSNDD